jgi:hypothetical protein
MHPKIRGPILARKLACWNWKCALINATARSLVYLAAMVRGGAHGQLAIVAVEVAYVTLTAGLYAGMQQKALGMRSRQLGDLIVVLGVPGLAQAVDSLAHRLAGAPAPARATVAVCIFAAVSALFHLYVMRRGAFLTGDDGHSLATDLRRVPALAMGFVLAPFGWIPALVSRLARALSAEAAA